MINNSMIQSGDFAIVDSNKTAPRIIKYLMRSETLWQDLYRMVTKTLEVPLYYHALLFLNKDEIIEQQGEVQIKTSEKILNTGNRLFIFRKRNLGESERQILIAISKESLGQWYGVMSCIGKTITWLTGIKFFARYIHISKTEICINRVAYWYKRGIRENFGFKTHTELTTHSLYKYVISHPEKFEIIYEGIPREDNNFN